MALKLRAQCPRAQGGGAADKRAGQRGNAILPTRAPGSFKRLLGGSGRAHCPPRDGCAAHGCGGRNSSSTVAFFARYAGLLESSAVPVSESKRGVDKWRMKVFETGRAGPNRGAGISIVSPRIEKVSAG